MTSGMHGCLHPGVMSMPHLDTLEDLLSGSKLLDRRRQAVIL